MRSLFFRCDVYFLDGFMTAFWRLCGIFRIGDPTSHARAFFLCGWDSSPRGHNCIFVWLCHWPTVRMPDETSLCCKGIAPLLSSFLCFRKIPCHSLSESFAHCLLRQHMLFIIRVLGVRVMCFCSGQVLLALRLLHTLQSGVVFDFDNFGFHYFSSPLIVFISQSMGVWLWGL